MWLLPAAAGVLGGPGKMWSMFVVILGLGAPTDSQVTMETKPMSNPIEVKLSLAPQSTTSDPVIEFTVRSPETRRFCLWHTPLEGMIADSLVVTQPDGKRSRYLGIMLKRRGPGPDDHVTLVPDVPKSATFSLGKSYDITVKGHYSVQFKGNPDINGLPDSNVLELDLE